MGRRVSFPHDAPLLAWGEALRAAKRQRRTRRRRIFVVAAGVAVVLGSALFPPAPRLVWNASASAPIGLYSVTPGAVTRTGDMVIAWPPMPVRGLAAERHYLPLNVPLVKRVAAVDGELVCAKGSVVTVEGRAIAVRRARDARGLSLPWWQGCVRLKGGARLLLMDDPGSFDGRYFGPTVARGIVGRAHLLWPR